MELLFIFIRAFIFFLFVYVQALFVWRKTNWPTYCPSLTKFGPSAMFRNPIEFTKQKRKEMKTDIFSCYFFFKRITFVFGQDNVYKVTSAPNEVLNFEESYGPFLNATFGSNMLTAYTLQPQVKVLTDYLTYPYLQEYVAKSAKLGSKLISEKFTSADSCNIEPILRDIVFQIGTRNFLGDKFLKALPDYDFKSIFSGFDIGVRLAMYYGPEILTWIKDYYDSCCEQSHFEKIVLELAKEKISNPTNMFEEIVYRHSDKDGPTLADDKTLTNLIKLFVFGSSFNSYNLICFILVELIQEPERWQKLKEEQRRIGFNPQSLTQEKLGEMELLNEEVMKIGSKHPFPFLLRTAKKDFELDGRIIPKGDIIAFSPRINDKTTDNLLFGLGVHACPAVKYAKNSMMVVLSLLIHHFTFTIKTPSEKFVNKRIITFSSQQPINVMYIRDS